jgi:hypothetical protein
MFAELTPKRLELLSELVPQTGVVSLLVNPNTPDTEPTTEKCRKRRARKDCCSIS